MLDIKTSVRSEVEVRQCTHSLVPDLSGAAITKPGVPQY